jgi:hypothetical protein
MRSDFIGDCARFHGLPEAVCEAQFLVPSLTRDQLNDVIRLPIEKAGASIEPKLVERLLNDCSTEMDQLPVLQHCLSRLWDQAGKAADVASPEDAKAEPSTNAVDGAHRRITEQHYRDIGEFAGALSQHADEILKELPGYKLQWAVEQIFRALSELDKEGRATRRALRYSRLVAETGVEESAVRQALDRFRASDCSFLIPPPSDVEKIEDDTRIDVGHEALLRRWDKVSGRGADLGWLRVEQQAGERYRALLAMADNKVTALPSNIVTERLAWWKARPRTPAWGERYGGGFAQVEGLLLHSRLRLRVKRFGVAVVFLVLLGAAIAMLLLWQRAEKAQIAAVHERQNADRASQEAVQASRKALQATQNALQATQKSIARLSGFLDGGTVRAKGAQKFLEDAQAALDEAAQTSEHSPEIAEIEISLLLAVSDVKDALGDYEEAARLAKRAEQLSNDFVRNYPDRRRFRHLLYASRFRVGDQLAKKIGNKTNEENALGEYEGALDAANKLAASEPGNTSYRQDVIVALNKVGDIYQHRHQWQEALDRYNEGLQMARSIADVSPVDEATEMSRIAQILSARDQPGDKQAAIDTYRQALDIQNKVLANKPDDSSRISNIALIHRRIGSLLADKPEEAQQELEAAVDGRKKLYQSDPGNMDWVTGLATDYTRLGDIFWARSDWRNALRNYNEAARVAGDIVSRNPESTFWKLNLAGLNAKRGEAQIARANELVNKPEPPQNESSRVVGTALDRYRSAEQTYAGLLNASHPPYAQLFEVRIRIGDILVRQAKFDDALQVYRSASELAQAASAGRRVVDWQISLAKAIEEAGDGLQIQLQLADATRPTATALVYYQNALEVIDAATAKAPDDPQLRSRREALNAKIAALQAPAK